MWDIVERLFFLFKQKTAYEMRISDWSTCALPIVLPAAVIGGGAALIQSDPSRLAATLARLVSLGLGYAVYIGIWIFVVLAVSSRMQTSRMALIELLGFWIASAVLLPRAISDLSNASFLSPSPTELNPAPAE